MNMINQSLINNNRQNQSLVNQQAACQVQLKKHQSSKIQIQKHHFSINGQQSLLITESDSSLFKQSQRVQQLIKNIKVKQITTGSYKNIVEQIANSFNLLDNLTQRLQQKVQYLLKQQQNQFVISYKIHMKKIKQQFQSFQNKIQKFNQKIKYYENQGKMSNLLHKLNQLQYQCKNLYGIADKKNKQLKDNQLLIKVQKSEIKRYKEQLKILIRQKNNRILKNTQTLENNQQRINNNQTLLINTNRPTLFTTQILQNRASDNRNYISKQQQQIFKSCKSLQKNYQGIPQRSFINPQNIILKKQSSPSQKIYQINKTRQIQLKRQVLSLKKRNKILNLCQNNLRQTKSELSQFFLNCVKQLKKDIMTRKKVRQCTLQDFRKQDKLELLIKVISHQEISNYLYERIFNKNKINIQSTSINFNHISTPLNKINIQSASINLNHLSSPLNRREINLTRQQRSIQRQYPDSTIITLKNNKQSIRKDEKNTLDSKNHLLSLSKNRRFSKNISQNYLLPKINFNLQY